MGGHLSLCPETGLIDAMTRAPKGWNGPSRELESNHHTEETVYCVRCGAVFVRAGHRKCPACTLAAVLTDMAAEVYGEDKDVW